MKLPCPTPALLLAAVLAPCCAPAQSAAPTNEYLTFIRTQAAALRAQDTAPTTLRDWQKQNAALRTNLLRAWGGFPTEPAPLNARKLGEIQRDGYRVEKIVFQTLPGVWMTANAYVPDKPGKLPAILAVHGHWRGAKQDPVVQARCIGPAKLGFFVLAVDAFGAGERGVGKALGEYHGEMTAATLLPLGRPLSGLQVYENMRAVDYLRSRPEVDGARIGVTGASGGGNQTMYAGAWDERFAAAVPVCSVGNYRAYLGPACCMCEVVPGALRFTEEWGVLGLTAPRGLMVVNATRDGIQFSVGEAKKSLAFVEPVFRLFGKPGHVRHAIFESPHDYNRAMREAMYGWMTLHLKGEGEGAPITDPEIKTEQPETLRCFPGDSRPDDWITIPKFAAAEARKLLAAKTSPASAPDWRSQSAKLREALANKSLGGFPKAGPLNARFTSAPDGKPRSLTFQPEPGLTLTATHEPAGRGAPLAILLDLDGADEAAASDIAAELRHAGWSLVTLDLRATGQLAWPRDKVGRAPDHTTAEWALWLGRPLLGQWTHDVRRLLDALDKTDGRLPRDVAVVGLGPAGIVALCAGALDPRITRVATVGTLAAFVTEEPYQGQRLGTLAPGILRDVGDIGHLAALAAPKRLVIAGGVSGGGTPLGRDALRASHTPAARSFQLAKAEDQFRLLDAADPAAIATALK